MIARRRPVAEVLGDVAIALRDPGLTHEASEGLACLMITEQCSLADARAALTLFLSKNDGWQSGGRASDLLFLLSHQLKQVRRQRPSLRIRPNDVERWGPTSNVLHTYFGSERLPEEQRGGYLTVYEWSVAHVRQELRSLHDKGLSNAVQGEPVANDNDPDLTVQGHWHTTVQAAWVQRQVLKNRESK